VDHARPKVTTLNTSSEIAQFREVVSELCANRSSITAALEKPPISTAVAAAECTTDTTAGSATGMCENKRVAGAWEAAGPTGVLLY
jgi:hypothetical protein